MKERVHKIAYFDFCKTLTRHYSFGLFVLFVLNKRNRLRLLAFKICSRLSSTLGVTLGNSNLARQLRGLSENELLALASEFSKSLLEGSYITATRDLLGALRAQGYEIVVVSAGLRHYIEKVSFASEISATIANELEFKNGICTGRLGNGFDIYGASKVVSILEYEKERFGAEPVHRYCVSDHMSDLPSLLLGQEAAVISQDDKLLSIARLRGWRIL